MNARFSSPSNPPTLRIGARGSLLSRMQSQLVADLLERRNPGLRVELVIVRTTGDKVADRPLADLGGKGLFTRELELALISGEIDAAIHSLKDVPVTQPLVDPSNLVIAAVPPREDPRDVLVSTRARTLAELPPGACVATGSPRRRAQILAARPDVTVEGIRGNIDTRLRKAWDEEWDGIVLAMAGLRRAGLFDHLTMSPLTTDEMLPAAGQGALALQCRRDNHAVLSLLQSANDPAAEECVSLERALVSALQGDCHSPIAAYATLQGSAITLRAAVGSDSHSPRVYKAQASADRSHPEIALAAVMESLLEQGYNVETGEYWPEALLTHATA